VQLLRLSPKLRPLLKELVEANICRKTAQKALKLLEDPAKSWTTEFEATVSVAVNGVLFDACTALQSSSPVMATGTRTSRGCMSSWSGR